MGDVACTPSTTDPFPPRVFHIVPGASVRGLKQPTIVCGVYRGEHSFWGGRHGLGQSPLSITVVCVCVTASHLEGPILGLHRVILGRNVCRAIGSCFTVRILGSN